MRDCLHIGSSPPMESCAQLGSPDYRREARRECNVYIRQLRRALGDEPDGARLAIKENPHDFGTYLDVVCWYDPDIKAAVDYAFKCESESPMEWDDQAKVELTSRKE